MEIYRITLAKWSDKLVASGKAARWNSVGSFVIYTAASRALACLENIVHRSGRGNNIDFKTIVIEVPKRVEMMTLQVEDLPLDWTDATNYTFTQAIGDSWVKDNKTAILKVPSAIIPNEYNYLLNPQHSDFQKIKITNIENFEFDSRL